ncbi:MAG: hypothetical protein Q9167_000494 [Letrouitia subvulpina]
MHVPLFPSVSLLFLLFSSLGNSQNDISGFLPNNDLLTVVTANQVLSLFGIALDTKQFATLSEVFAVEAVLDDIGEGATTGLPAIVDFYTSQFQNASVVTQHKSDTVFVYSLTKTTAKAISYANAVYFGPPTLERGGFLFRNNSVNFYERFDDNFVRGPGGGWKISRRKLTIVTNGLYTLFDPKRVVFYANTTNPRLPTIHSVPYLAPVWSNAPLHRNASVIHSSRANQYMRPRIAQQRFANAVNMGTGYQILTSPKSSDSMFTMAKGRLTGGALRRSIASVCGVAFLLFGYDQGVLGAVIGLPSFREEFNDPSRNLEGIIAGIYDIGCFVGAIVAFLTADRFGRKGSIKWGSWIMVVGTILQTSATENVQMILSRLITGIGNGVNTVNVPIWQAESFKSHNRGAMLVIQSALIAFGHPLSTFMGLASSQAKHSSFSWRWPIAFQGVFLILILLALPFLPESPRWLIQHDRIEEATETFARLEGPTATTSDPKVIKERDMVMASVQQEREMGSASWAEVFTEGKNRNLSRVLLGAGPYM